eukprot:CAMPEP_0197246666 /NCGR_PEP_ID=MMETSP1429-20130617/19315_1 /TAXON_ID=49237 /ORGANISM="Chaetoceros  sp., Strain UNC1202" /LENGTH=204 /DNA_ID=CAMNT_0042707387 /DNA_START=38 /DNA_END=652 /DNA_ORIENTATION=+
MKLSVLVALSMPLTGSAFAPTMKTSTAPTTTMLMSQPNDEQNKPMNALFRPLGTVAIAASLAFSPIAANAQELHQYQQSPLSSSSVQISETIKVLDMGMPSYGSIADPRAKQDSIKAAEPDKDKSTTGVLSSKSSGSAGGMFASSGGSKKKAAAAAQKKDKVALERTQKVEVEKDEISNVVTIDMSMPSYSDNAASKKKSVFAL